MLYQGTNCFKIILFACLILFGCSCDKNSVDTEEGTYWTMPKWEGIYLSFHHSEDIEVDSVLAGNIQYRLNVARSVDEQLAGWGPFPCWVAKQLLLLTTAELYAAFDTLALRFGVEPLDSLLALYSLERAKKVSFGYFHDISLFFIEDYNIPILAKIFESIEGIVYAEPNGVDYIYPPLDIEITIDGDTYQFMFIGGWDYPGNWEIHVVDDQATVISRP